MTSKRPALSDDTAIYLIRDSVAKRSLLIHGALDDDRDGHCALGWFWIDNPLAPLSTKLIDEVATVNDSLGPTATPHERWLKVNSWLQWKLRVMV